jgi:transcriptional regulator with XRE-family HTH domain
VALLEEPSVVREARLALGLSQAALASAAGVSRQAVGAIEAGQHRPSVDAALAIAQALGRPVEELFGRAPGLSSPILGGEVPEGAPVLAARVGERLVHAPAYDALAVEGWPQPNAVLRGGRPELLSDGDLNGFVVVGCDPAVGLAAAMLPARGSRRVIAVSASTAASLAALGDGRTHAAIVHARADELPAPPVSVVRFGLARWSVGLASAGRSPRSVGEVCSTGAGVVQRDAGASSQKAFLAAVERQGLRPPPGPIASGHLDVARRVAVGSAPGVTMEPAALSHRLAFTPLEEHVVEVWVDACWREHPAVEALGTLLRSRAFTERLSLVGGYDLAACGAARGEENR